MVDASLVAAAAFGEPRSREAVALMGAHALHAPSLLPYELAHIAWKKIRQAPADRATILDQLTHSKRMHIELREADRTEVAELASATGLSGYDAAYLWVARALSTDLITFDARLAAAARSLRG